MTRRNNDVSNVRDSDAGMWLRDLYIELIDAKMESGTIRPLRMEDLHIIVNQLNNRNEFESTDVESKKLKILEVIAIKVKDLKEISSEDSMRYIDLLESLTTKTQSEEVIKKSLHLLGGFLRHGVQEVELRAKYMLERGAFSVDSDIKQSESMCVIAENYLINHIYDSKSLEEFRTKYLGRLITNIRDGNQNLALSSARLVAILYTEGVLGEYVTKESLMRCFAKFVANDETSSIGLGIGKLLSYSSAGDYSGAVIDELISAEHFVAAHEFSTVEAKVNALFNLNELYKHFDLSVEQKQGVYKAMTNFIHMIDGIVFGKDSPGNHDNEIIHLYHELLRGVNGLKHRDSDMLGGMKFDFYNLAAIGFNKLLSRAQYPEQGYITEQEFEVLVDYLGSDMASVYTKLIALESLQKISEDYKASVSKEFQEKIRVKSEGFLDSLETISLSELSADALMRLKEVMLNLKSDQRLSLFAERVELGLANILIEDTNRAQESLHYERLDDDLPPAISSNHDSLIDDRGRYGDQLGSNLPPVVTPNQQRVSSVLSVAPFLVGGVFLAKLLHKRLTNRDNVHDLDRGGLSSGDPERGMSKQGFAERVHRRPGRESQSYSVV